MFKNRKKETIFKIEYGINVTLAMENCISICCKFVKIYLYDINVITKLKS